MLCVATLCLKLASAGDSFDPGPNPILAKHPTVNQTSVVFEYAGDLWRVPRAGGEAVRLTASSGGSASDPIFSPDGTKIAFTADYDGNQDAYVMDAEGGSPKRLTTHPAGSAAVGWSPDGKQVLVRSSMLSNTDYLRLFTVSVNGGYPRALPFPAGQDGSLSPDGSQLAYVPNPRWEQAWKRYRGGQASPIWVGNLNDSKVVRLPWKGTNDLDPLWIGDSIYYLSDPTGPVGLSRWDLRTHQASVVIPGRGFDIKSATAGPGVIAYEKLGSIHLFDLASKQDQVVPITIHGDFPAARVEWKPLQRYVTSVEPSPTGQRVVVCARGWTFSVPAQKGDTRLIDDRQGVDRRDGVWSPDGKTIAYTREDDGGAKLALFDTATLKEKLYDLGAAPGDYGNLNWSPDSLHLAYTDNKLNLWLFDVATGANRLVDTGTYRASTDNHANWSPDSKWLTFTRDHLNYLNTVVLYNLATGKATEITDPLAQASSPVFDRGGKYLYFLASTDLGFSIDDEDIMSLGVANTSAQVYAVLLKSDIPNPFTPESDEEEGITDKKPDGAKAKAPFDIDLDGIRHRIFAVPMPRASYNQLLAGPEGSFFARSAAVRLTPVDFPGPGALVKYTLSDRKSTTFADGVSSASVTADGKKLLIDQGGWKFVGTEGSAEGTATPIDLSDMRARIDPMAEWRAMYHQVWRQERILFYDPGLHGIDSNVMERRYEPFLANIRSRSDLNYLFTDMLGELCIGHMFIGGGDMPTKPRESGGLLGADYELSNGRYRIKRIYDGESWNPDLSSPLGAAGVGARVGDYILRINGKEVTQSNDIYLALEGLAGKRVSVEFGPNADGSASRKAFVTPISSEEELRSEAWEEDNRRYVDQQTGGKCGYIHVPDTETGGWRAFMRYYYAQNDKQAMIIDERFNHGGAINDFMVREMEKPLDFYGASRYGQLYVTPNAAVYGPKVMLANEMAGSGGDIFPYIFKAHKTGPLIGKKTWGGELSAFGFRLIDGGSVRAPDDAQIDPKTGDYVIDNVGVSPDIEVDLEPDAWRAGVDSQLKMAVDTIKKQVASWKPFKLVRPKYPDKSKLPGQ